jgi:hypothetical protein
MTHQVTPARIDELVNEAKLERLDEWTSVVDAFLADYDGDCDAWAAALALTCEMDCARARRGCVMEPVFSGDEGDEEWTATLSEMVENNPDDSFVLEQLSEMAVGETRNLGGGASGDFVVTRVS